MSANADKLARNAKVHDLHREMKTSVSELVGVTKLAREDDVPVGVRASTSITNSTEDVDARNDVSVSVARGTQRVAKGRDGDDARNDVFVVLACVQTTKYTGRKSGVCHGVCVCVCVCVCVL